MRVVGQRTMVETLTRPCILERTGTCAVIGGPDWAKEKSPEVVVGGPQGMNASRSLFGGSDREDIAAVGVLGRRQGLAERRGKKDEETMDTGKHGDVVLKRGVTW